MTRSNNKLEQPNSSSFSLYYRQSCPYCLKVLNELEQLDTEVELRNIGLNAAHHLELAMLGGLQQVPCLQIVAENGSERWLYESDDIIRYLRHQDASTEARQF